MGRTHGGSLGDLVLETLKPGLSNLVLSGDGKYATGGPKHLPTLFMEGKPELRCLFPNDELYFVCLIDVAGYE